MTLFSRVFLSVQIVKLGVSLGVDRIKGHHLWAHFKQIKDQNLRRSSDAIRRWNGCVVECQSIAREQLLPNGKQVRDLTSFFVFNRMCLDQTGELL